MLIVSLGLLCLPPLGRAGSALHGHAQREKGEKGEVSHLSMCGEGRNEKLAQRKMFDVSAVLGPLIISSTVIQFIAENKKESARPGE